MRFLCGLCVIERCGAEGKGESPVRLAESIGLVAWKQLLDVLSFWGSARETPLVPRARGK